MNGKDKRPGCRAGFISLDLGVAGRGSRRQVFKYFKVLSWCSFLLTHPTQK